MASPPPTATHMYASIRDQLASEITAGVYPAGALLPSIREIMQRWEVSTTTARKALDELAASGFARKESTRGHISTGGPQASAPVPPPPASTGREYSPVGDYARKPPPPIAVPGRLTIRPEHTIPADGSINMNEGNGIGALDVRAEQAPVDAVLALRITDRSRPVIVRRRLLAAADNTPVQLRVSYLPKELAESTPIAQPQTISEAWPTALATHLGIQVHLASSQVTARHPHPEEAAALALPSDAAVLVRLDIYEDDRGTPVDYTRTVWPGDTTRLAMDS